MVLKFTHQTDIRRGVTTTLLSNLSRLQKPWKSSPE